MQFDIRLQHGFLIRRYKRFLADIRLPDKRELTVHCPNSGSMRSCSEPGSPVCFSVSDNPKRKYPHTLEMIQIGNTWVGVNTSRTNSIVVEGIETGAIKGLQPYTILRREVTTSKSSRLDIMLESISQKTYIEVKNCSLVEDDCARFPDAVTARGTKHLVELARLVAEGHKGVIFYLVQRLDAERFAPAATIDPLYTHTLRQASERGVQILAYQAAVSPESIEIVRELPVSLDG